MISINSSVIPVIITLASVLMPIVMITIIVLIIVSKVRHFTKSTLNMTPTQTANLISDGLKQEMFTPKPITSLSAVYAPKIERDFPQVGYNGMDTLARNTLVSTLNAIEDKSAAGLTSCSHALISKVQNIIDDLNSKNEDEIYNNIKIHKSGISSYMNKQGEAVATFEISLQYEFTRKKDGNPMQGLNNSLVQAVYRVLLTYNQSEHEETTSIVYSSNCPNCGAPINVAAKEKVCPYCGGGFTEIADRVWQVTDFNLIK